MKIILIINPGNPTDTGPDQSWGKVRRLLYLFKLFSKVFFALPLALPTLAVLTPKKHTVKIIDEMIRNNDFDKMIENEMRVSRQLVGEC